MNRDNDLLSDEEAKQKAYYERIASTYDAHYGSDHSLDYRRAVYDSVMRDYPVEEWKALDAMCGGGQNSAYFIERGCDVRGIDISEQQCQHYKERFPDSEVTCGSALETPFDDGSFDLIFTDSLHHLPPYVDRAMHEFHRILRPGGLLLAWEPSAKSMFDYARKLWYRLDRKYFEDNEESIDFEKLARDNQDLFRLERVVYGGNVAYLTVGLSMAMRIPLHWVDYYARPAQWLETKLTPLQTRTTSLWALALLQKR